MKVVNVLLFDGFTAMDALGPAEVLSRAREGRAKMLRDRDFGLLAGSWAVARALKFGRES